MNENAFWLGFWGIVAVSVLSAMAMNIYGPKKVYVPASCVKYYGPPTFDVDGKHEVYICEMK